MKLYTSYFAKQARIDPGDKIFVSIAAGGVPKWFPYECIVYSPLVPNWGLVMDKKKNLITWEEYERRYWEEKDFEHSRLRYTVDLMKISDQHDNKDLVILCFEKRRR